MHDNFAGDCSEETLDYSGPECERLACKRSRWLAKLSKKTLAVRNCAGEILGNRLPHIGERLAHAEIHARASVRRGRHNGNIFTRMVGGGPARIAIAAVVCSDH